MSDNLKEIWDRTVAPVLNAEHDGAERSNGMNEQTSKLYEDAGDLDYSRIVEEVRAGRL